jgi:FkbM family methyltransferase
MMRSPFDQVLEMLTQGQDQPMVSYAQNGEDVLLRRCFPSGHGFYVDVGANDPVYHSVTKYFYERGWSGVNVEPIKRHYLQLVADRPRDTVLNVGLSDREGTLTFYEARFVTALSTFSKSQADGHRARGLRFEDRTVPITTLAAVCESASTGAMEIDFLSIDVEGHERAVLDGGDWKRFRPRVVLVEAARPLTRIEVHLEWEAILVNAGYLAATFDGLNRYYVRSEDKHLVDVLRSPISVFDNYVPYEYFRHVRAFRLGIERALRADDMAGELKKLLARLDEFGRDPQQFRLGVTRAELELLYKAL